MKTTILKTFFVILAYSVAAKLAIPFGIFYDQFPSTSLGGSFIGGPGAWESIAGYPLAVIFTLTFLLHAHGAKFKWHWNVLALAPVIIFELGFDLLHIYIPLLLVLVAWGLGVLTNIALIKLAPSFMSRIS